MQRLIFSFIVLLISTDAFAETIRVVQTTKTFVGNLSDSEVAALGGDPDRVKEKKLLTVKAKVGDTITFANRDTATHNIKVESDSETLLDVGAQEPGAAHDRNIDLKKKGEFRVRCLIHPKMKLQLLVE